jgi:hypothetical protein
MSNDTRLGTEWVELPDLWLFIRTLVFHASTEAICGSFLLSLNPTLTEDFWAFDHNIPTLLKGIPRWLAPGAHKSREKMLIAIKNGILSRTIIPTATKRDPTIRNGIPILGQICQGKAEVFTRDRSHGRRLPRI